MALVFYAQYFDPSYPTPVKITFRRRRVAYMVSGKNESPPLAEVDCHIVYFWFRQQTGFTGHKILNGSCGTYIRQAVFEGPGHGLTEFDLCLHLIFADGAELLGFKRELQAFSPL
jgi:hypothetical protein